MRSFLRIVILSTLLPGGFHGVLAAAEPAISAVMNNFSWMLPGLPNYGIAPGSIFTIFGSGMGPSQIVSQAFPLQQTVAGVSLRITVNGVETVALPYYVSATAAAAVLPSNTPVGRGKISVSYNGQTSAPADIQVVAAAFGILTLDGSGSGMAAAFDSQSRLLGLTNAANPGDTIVIWGTGLGAARGGDEARFPFPQENLNTPIQVLVGGRSAEVTYHGRSAYPGLDQINFVVPPGVSGCSVGMTVRTGALLSNFVAIPISPASRTCSDPSLGLSGPEISRMLAGNSMNVGSISIGKTLTQSGSGTEIQTDEARATFRRFMALQFTSASGPLQQASPGSCVVWSSRLTTATPQLIGLPMDAGPTINLTTPGGTVIPMTRTTGSGGGYSVSAGGVPGTPGYQPPFIPDSGGTFRFENGGGEPVGTFSASVEAGRRFQWTNRGQVGTNVDITRELNIELSGGDPASYVVITGTAIQTSPTVLSTAFSCTFAGAAQGRFAISPDVLSSLVPMKPVSGSAPATGTLSVSAYRPAAIFSAPGLDAVLIRSYTTVSTKVNFYNPALNLLPVCPLWDYELRVEQHDSRYRAARGGASGAFRSGQAADMMLSGFGFNKTGGALTFNHNSGIATDGTRLLLADRNNNRVLIWNRVPAANTPPDLVLGQPDFHSNDSGSGRNQLNWPMSVSTDGQRVVVADTYNDRILIWNKFPVANAAPADLQIKIIWPWGVWTDGKKLLATGTTLGYALLWNSFPTRDDQPADIRLDGGGNFGTPRAITSNGQVLMIGDYSAKGTASPQGSWVWRQFPTSNRAADFFYYRPDRGYLQGAFFPDGRLAMYGGGLYLWNAPLADAQSRPDLSVTDFFFRAGGGDVALVGGAIFISDGNLNRVLVYNTTPTRPDQPPDWALGSPDLCTNTLEANFIITNGVPASNGVNLFVSSDFDHKLHVWKKVPDEDGAHPDIVYHFPDQPTQSALWNDTLTLAGFNSVYVWTKLPLDGRLPDRIFEGSIGSIKFQNLSGVAYDGHYFYLADREAGKIYIWDGLPSAGSEPKAVLAVGPMGRLSTDGTWLVVTPWEARSILVYRVADLFGNPKPVSIGKEQLSLPAHSLAAQGRLFVSDTGNNRVLVWNKIEDAVAGRDADAILGLPTDRVPATRRNGLFMPSGLSFDGSYLWVGEFKFSNRILRYSLGGPDR